MSRREPAIAVCQMLDHAREAAAMAEGRSRADLDRDRQWSLAVARLLEIIGEAARRVPDDVRARRSSIPWTEVIAFRNRLIHGYDAVDHDIVWSVLRDDLPPLIAELESLLAEMNQ